MSIYPGCESLRVGSFNAVRRPSILPLTLVKLLSTSLEFFPNDAIVSSAIWPFSSRGDRWTPQDLNLSHRRRIPSPRGSLPLGTCSGSSASSRQQLRTLEWSREFRSRQIIPCSIPQVSIKVSIGAYSQLNQSFWSSTH